MNLTKVLFALIVLFIPADLFAQDEPTADQILAEVDAVAKLASDFTADLELVTVEDGEETARSLQLWQKGESKRMLKITAPARLKGVGLLNDGEVFHVYLPAFGKVRRVAGRDRGQRFFDSVFSQDDMARTQYAARFTPSLLPSDDAETWTLRLDPEDPDDEPHHHLVVVVQRADHLLRRIDCYDEEGGKPVRTLKADDFRVVGVLPLAFVVTAEEPQSGVRSTATLSNVQVDVGLEDSFFSKRQLERSP